MHPPPQFKVADPKGDLYTIANANLQWAMDTSLQPVDYIAKQHFVKQAFVAARDRHHQAIQGPGTKRHQLHAVDSSGED